MTPFKSKLPEPLKLKPDKFEIDPLEPSCKVPACTVVVPVYVFAPFKINFEFEAF